MISSRFARTALLVAPLSGLVGCIGPSDNMPDPKSAAVYDVAADAFSKGQIREALSKVEEALKLDSHNAEAEHLGAIIYLAFCAKDPSSSDCHFDEAERLARGAVAHNEENREAKNTLAVVLIHRKKYDDAIAVLKPLTADILYNSPQVSWGNLGWAYLEKGAVDEAVDALRRSVAAQPAFCVGNYRLGAAYEKKGELRAAKEAYTRALETDRPGCRKIQEAWEGRGRVAKKLGLVEQARTDLGKCVQLSKATTVATRCEGLLRGLPAAEVAPAEGPSAANTVNPADQAETTVASATSSK